MDEKIRDFVTVSELARGFDEYALPQSGDFSGKSVTLHLESGETVGLRFVSEEALLFTQGETPPIAAAYILTAPREGIYYLSCVVSYGDTRSFAAVLDTKAGIATAAFGILPTKEEALVSQFERGEKNLPLTSVRVEFYAAAIDRPFTADTPRHEATDELVGHRIRFTYSANDEYEHIYLTEKSYTWRCVRGIEAGLADTELCYYRKIADKLYWFCWAERVVPTIGSVVEDLAAMRSYGTLYGYEDYTMGRVKNVPAGSYAKIVD
ncbi:MAG: molybdenum cofactor biosynthesis F family protein [Oscillospiraceae bacterium]|jgi:hypothetical protein|nr:molybdenum cofactor biosynthesis F family protein [Oscillospiraceae bacterium]